ncbi:MAG TPA: hypothetical protein VF230_13460 [Acidimicrobiales bacterium]
MTRRIASFLVALLVLTTGLVLGVGPAPSVSPAGAYPLGDGYWLAATDGGMFSFGDAQFFGSMGGTPLSRPVVGMVAHPFLEGYWLVASDGGVFSFGSAGFFGSTGDKPLNSPIVGMASTPTGLGYWLVAADGGIFTFGDAVFYGSEGGTPLNRPIVGMAATPTGKGYWLVATDGGIFTHGDATFHGSQGARPLNKPVTGMAATPSGAGYYLVASDGGIFTHGDAVFRGSRGGEHLNAPVVGMALSPSGRGYQFVATDGGIFNYGDSTFFGSRGGQPLNRPVLGMAVRPRLAMKVDAFGPSHGSTWTQVGSDWQLRLTYTAGRETPAGARVYGFEGLDVTQLGTMGFTLDAGTCGNLRFAIWYDTNQDRVGDARKDLTCSGPGEKTFTDVAAGVPSGARVTAIDLLYTTAGTVDVDRIMVAGLLVEDFSTVRQA